MLMAKAMKGGNKKSPIFYTEIELDSSLYE